MRLTRTNLRRMILEALDDQERKNSEAAMGDFKTWTSGLMSIMGVQDESKIPSITPYDAYTKGMDPTEYAVFVGEPEDEEEMVSSPVSGDSDEDWIYDLEGEMEAKMQGMESGNVVDLSDYADEY
jgi:hypothetical protein